MVAELISRFCRAYLCMSDDDEHAGTSSSEYGDLGAAAHGHAEGDRQLEYMRRFERRYDGDEGASGGQCCPMETSSGPESDDEMEVEEQRREAAITARSGATRLARGATAVGRIQQPCRHLPLWQVVPGCAKFCCGRADGRTVLSRSRIGTRCPRIERPLSSSSQGTQEITSFWEHHM